MKKQVCFRFSSTTITYFRQMKISSIIALTLLFSCSTKNSNNPELVITPDTTRVKYNGDKVKHSVGIRNGKFNGERFYFNENDSTTTIDHFYNGQLHGDVKVRYAHGQPKIEGCHNQDKKTGIWKHYYENQNIEQIQFFGNDGTAWLMAKWNYGGELIELHSAIKILRYGNDSILIIRERLAGIRLELLLNGQYREVLDHQQVIPFLNNIDSVSGRYRIEDLIVPFKRKILDLDAAQDRNLFLRMD
jgi:hypothetical protein